MYQITCKYAYSIFGECPTAISNSTYYNLIGESLYYSGCFLMESVSRPVKRIIVPKDKVQEISSIKLESEAASS